MHTECAILSIFLFLTSLHGEKTIVRTNYGPVSGNRNIVFGKHVYEFLGIPFAQPPIGDLRFKHPKKPISWKTIHNATSLRAACMQTPPHNHKHATTRIWEPQTDYSEDCLYLNIWTSSWNHTTTDDHHNRQQQDAIRNGPTPLFLESANLFGPKSGRPVMVWIHGGNLNRGAASVPMYDGKYLAGMMDLVIVTIQYRLGPFGFLYLGTEDAPGNQGLMDQVMALEWVRENIAYFGGNPQQVTLFGHTGSAVSVGLHLLSPMSKNLFQQAILQSSSPLAWWAVESESVALEKARYFGVFNGCRVPQHTPRFLQQLADCLRSVDPLVLEENHWKFKKGTQSSRAKKLQKFYGNTLNADILLDGHYFYIPFKPVVIKPLIPKWPYEVLSSGKLNIRHRIMMGVNKDEAMRDMIENLHYFENVDQYPVIPQEMLSDPFNLLTMHIMDENLLHPTLIQAILFEYQMPKRSFRDNDRREVLERLNEIGGDYNMKCPLIEFADFYSQSSNAQVFLYSFEHRNEGTDWPQWTGVMQGYEAEYIFGAPFNPEYGMKFYNFTEDERRLSEEMMKFWRNFASTGSPNLNPGEYHTRSKDLSWERYTNPSATELANLHPVALFSNLPELDNQSRKHMVFTLPNSYMGQNLQRHHCIFWREHLPLLRKDVLMKPNCENEPGGSLHTPSGQPSHGTFYPNPDGRKTTSHPNSSKYLKVTISIFFVCLLNDFGQQLFHNLGL